MGVVAQVTGDAAGVDALSQRSVTDFSFTVLVARARMLMTSGATRHE
jgi:hypothetical protein